MLAEWQDIQNKSVLASRENFFYYVMKKYQSSAEGQGAWQQQLSFEKERGIHRFPSMHAFDTEAQVIELSSLNPDNIDARINPARAPAARSGDF